VSRLPAQSGELIDRASAVSFTFDGRPVTAFAGDTIGSALYASGQRTFSRSFKYHRRRGLMCVAGQCPNCLVCVDGAPGVRACTEPVRAGARVEHLNARPGLQFDAMSAVDRLAGPFTPPGFYYKTFMRPRRLWPVYERVLRAAAGLGRLPGPRSERTWQTRYRRRHADLLVVGGGIAGLTAAIAAARLGADVVLADDGPEPGGRLLGEGQRTRARDLTAAARAAGVEVLKAAAALGHYDGLVAVWRGDTLHQIRARQYVYATGAIEQPLVFEGNDVPGVMLSGGALRLISAYAVAPGRRAVVVTVADHGHEAALALQAAGVEVAAVADLRTHLTAAAARTSEQGIDVLQGWTVLASRGRRHVRGVVLAPVGDGLGETAVKAARTGSAATTPVTAGAGAGVRREFDCDLIVVCGGHVPAAGLVAQAGGRLRYDSERLALSDVPAATLTAGDVAGEGTPELAAQSGELAGLRAAQALAIADDAAAARAAALAAQLDGASVPGAAVAPVHPHGRPAGRAFVCMCEDVTTKDIHLGVREGYDSLELAKRYTTVTMGPCQGRMCQQSAARAVAAETGTTAAQVGTTTARPPWSSVPLGALAGRPFAPAKRSAIEPRHRALGATIRWAGDWKRPYDYGDVEAEVAAVHQAAGLIDVSSLGKLLVCGPQAGDFLDRMYPNRISDMPVGRLRYGLLSNEAGRILDDGTICRLADAEFLVTTTSSGAGAAEQWFAWWLADWDMDVRLVDVTQALAAVNLAGPRAREILAKLTDTDISAAAFGYLGARQAQVAGVSALLLRLGFVGELGYEIHFPAAHGAYLWDAILAAGSEAGIRPVGLEAQRVLRLEKRHIIVGQDTDSESTPFAAGVSWAVKLDRPTHFIGRAALSTLVARASETVLVGFRVASGSVPTEGSVVLDAAGSAAGQVTSARRSRQVGEVIGIAWVPAHLAADGTDVVISDAGTHIAATVVTAPFYDPAGALQRS
jgi:sarcosine oxidase subunit alpha